MWVCCRDIDPAELAGRGLGKKGHFSTSWKQMARDTGPPTSPMNGEPGDRSRKLEKRALRATAALFAVLSFSLSRGDAFDCCGTHEMPVTGIALRGARGQRTFVTAAAVIIGNRQRPARLELQR